MHKIYKMREETYDLTRLNHILEAHPGARVVSLVPALHWMVQDNKVYHNFVYVTVEFEDDDDLSSIEL